MTLYQMLRTGLRKVKNLIQIRFLFLLISFITANIYVTWRFVSVLNFL